eukprot:15444687-Alexandrium_andersonii.AAC.1
MAGSDHTEPFSSGGRDSAPLDGSIESRPVGSLDMVEEVTQGALGELSIPLTRVSNPEAKPLQGDGRPVRLRSRAIRRRG